MTDRNIKIVVKTEIQKGFGDLSKQIADLSKNLQGVASLQSSLNNLVGQFDKANKFRDAAADARKLAEAQRSVNSEISAGVRLTQANQSAQDKYLQSLQKINAAEKAGKVSSDQRLQAEISLTEKLIQKTNDLSIISNRNARGQFVKPPVSKEAARAVQSRLAQSSSTVATIKPPIDLMEADRLYSSYVNAINKGGAQVKTAMQKQIESITNSNYGNPWAELGTKERSQLASYYAGLQVTVKEDGVKLVTEIDNQAARIRNAMARMIAPDPVKGEARKRMQMDYDKLFGATPAATPTREPPRPAQGRSPFVPTFGGGGGGGGSGGGWGPPESAIDMVKKLTHSYTALGETLFRLQYSTYTLFAVTGLEAVTKMIDKYTELRNTIARTSKATDDIAPNVKDVFNISRRSFTDPEDTAKLYSRVNSYAKPLGINQGEVGNITQNLGSVISAGSLNQAMKTRSITELNEVMSGAAGGRQYQALMRENSLIIPMVQKYLAKKEGLPEGQVPAVTGKGAKIKPSDVIDTFNESKNTGITAQITSLQRDKDRTTGDIKTEFMTDLTQYIGEAKDSFNGLQSAINGLANFLSDYNKFSAFMHGIEDATVAIATFATITTAKSLIAGGGSAIGGAINAVGNVSAAVRDAKLLGGLGKGAAEFTDAAMVAEHSEQLAASMSKLSGPMQTLVPLFAGTATGAELLGAALLVAGGVVTLLAVGAAVFAFRLNSLLRTMGDGISIFDIIKGLWVDLTHGAGDLINKIPLVSQIFKAIMDGIDNLAKWVIGWAKHDLGVRGAEVENKFGIKNLKRIAGSDDKFAGTDSEGHGVGLQLDKAGNWIQDKNGRAAIFQGSAKNWSGIKNAAGQQLYEKTTTEQRDAKRAYGISNNAVNEADKNKAPKDPGQSPFASITATINKAMEDAKKIAQNVDVNDGWASINKAVNSKIDGLNETINKEASKLGQSRTDILRKRVIELTATLTNSELADGVRKFNDEITKLEVGFSKKLTDSRLSSDASDRDSFSRSGLQSLSKTAAFVNSKTLQSTLDKYITANSNEDLGGFDVTTSKTLIPSKASELDRLKQAQADPAFNNTPDAKAAFTRLINDLEKITKLNQLAYGDKTGDIRTATRISGVTNGYFGNDKDRQSSYLAEIQTYKNTFSKEQQDPKVLQDRLNAVKESYTQLDAYNAKWSNGAKEAIAEYGDNIKNVATQFKDAFSHALDGIQNALVGFLQTGKLDLRKFATDILTDVENIAVKQIIMKPITNALGNFFGGNKSNSADALSQANTLLPTAMDANTQATINNTMAMAGQAGSAFSLSNPLGGAMGADASFAALGNMKLPGSSGGLSGLFNGGLSILAPFLGPFAPLLSLIGMHHNGGFAGSATQSKLVNPAVFGNARRYHTGGFAGLPALSPSEVPAILQRGEQVLTIPQQLAMKNSGGGNTNNFSPKIEVNYQGGNGANSSKEDAAAMADLINTQIEKKYYELTKTNLRPGGALYQSR